LYSRRGVYRLWRNGTRTESEISSPCFCDLRNWCLANSGEDEFDEIFKLLIAKLWTNGIEPRRFSIQKTPDETRGQITALLREATDAWPGILEGAPVSRLTPAHLEVCVQAMQPHTIGTSGLEVMDTFFEFLVSTTAKGSKGSVLYAEAFVDFLRPRLHPAFRTWFSIRPAGPAAS